MSSRGLLRSTLVLGIYYFSNFSIKSIYALCFLAYMYYKRTLVVSGFALAKRCLEKVFKPAQKVFKCKCPQTILKTPEILCTDFIYLSHVFLLMFFDFSVLQASLLYDLSCSFTKYVVYSLPHFPFF